MVPSKSEKGPKLLMNVDWNNNSFQTKQFTDNSITYDAVLVPLSM